MKNATKSNWCVSALFLSTAATEFAIATIAIDRKTDKMVVIAVIVILQFSFLSIK
jgi:hypothetical protein